MTMTHSIYKAGAATLLAGFLAIGLFAQGRSAFAYTPKASGQPGLIQVPVTQGAYNGAGWPQVTFPTRYVWRSAGYADTQDITLTYRVWKYNATSGGWPLYTSHVMSARVAPNGVGAWFTGWYFNVPFDSFAVNVEVTWRAVDGTYIGWKVIDYNIATDYQCLTGTTCSVLPNASVGAFIYLHPAPQPVVQPQPIQSAVSQPTGNSSTFSVGGGNVDLGVTSSAGGSQTFTISGSGLTTGSDAVDRIYDRILYDALHGPRGDLYPKSLMDSLVYGIVIPRNAWYELGRAASAIVPW